MNTDAEKNIYTREDIMKNIHNQNEKKFHYSLRKMGGKGVVSAVIAIGFFFLGTSAVEAADVSSTEAVASSKDGVTTL